jgi:hypothetical protein
MEEILLGNGSRMALALNGFWPVGEPERTRLREECEKWVSQIRLDTHNLYTTGNLERGVWEYGNLGK